MDPADFAIVQLVSRAGVILGDQIADRAFAADPDSFVRRRQDAALKRLVAKGYLATRPVVVAVADAQLGNPSDARKRVGKLAFEHAYYATDRASAELNLALPATTRDPLVQHNLKTLDALHQVEREVRSRGGRVIDFKMEAQLVRENFKGRVFGGPGQQVLPKFPDAVLTASYPDGSHESINVEYVSSKYTDKMISEKARAFSGRVVWAASNARTAARVHAITGQEPLRV